MDNLQQQYFNNDDYTNSISIFNKRSYDKYIHWDISTGKSAFLKIM
jgi:hypothetical protein